MSKYYFKIFIVLIILSCNTNKKKITTNSSKELQEKLNPFSNTIWVESGYIEDILKTKSPLKSSKKLAFISEMILGSATASVDSVEVGISLANHEGGNFAVYFKQGKNLTSFLTNIIDYDKETNSYELSYEIKNGDTTLTLYHYDENRKVLDETNYIKIPIINRDNSLEKGFQYMVNTKLISGNYIMIDSAENKTKIQFDSNGNIAGFPGYKTYYIITDFVAEEENTIDQICFDIQTKYQKCYGYKINGDTLSLFNVITDDERISFQSGPPIFKLVKEK